MSFLDNIKDVGDKANKAVAQAHQEHKQKVADQKDAKGKKIEVLVNAEYLGGYDKYRKTLGNLTFFDKQVKFHAVLNAKFTIPNEQIANVAIEGSNMASKRVTATRLLAIGIFAFAVKKNDNESYLTFELKDGQEVIFKIKSLSPAELKAKLNKVLVNYKSKPATTQADGNSSVADELGKLAKLKEQGILTQAEFDKKKQELLG
jgi:hypothetical protein